MARPGRRRTENVAGDVYVDDACIDCDACRWIAPDTFDRVGGMSRVRSQPDTSDRLHRALMAAVACPTASIGTLERHPMAPAIAAFPAPITHGVFHCGFHHPGSFGAASYLLVRPSGNVLVDSPRFAAPLVAALERMGGVATILLTHSDDVGDHARFAARFGAERILHAADVTEDTADVERRVTGFDPVPLGDDATILPVPGHTEGSLCLLWRDVLFSGDHVWWSEGLGHLASTTIHCQHSWERQRRSMEGLLAHDIRWVLPGHGRRACLPPEKMRASLRRCIAWMERTG